jgi:hypothetical protein
MTKKNIIINCFFLYSLIDIVNKNAENNKNIGEIIDVLNTHSNGKNNIEVQIDQKKDQTVE